MTYRFVRVAENGGLTESAMSKASLPKHNDAFDPIVLIRASHR
jgi:hypothetical protein